MAGIGEPLVPGQHVFAEEVGVQHGAVIEAHVFAVEDSLGTRVGCRHVNGPLIQNSEVLQDMDEQFAVPRCS